MKKLTAVIRVSLIPFFVAGLASARLAAQDAGFSSGIEAGGTWDSNFARSPTAEEERTSVEERIGRAALNVKYANTFSKQNLSAALRFNHYDYQNNDVLDADFLTGKFDWKGQIARKILFDLNAVRDAYAVDPLEFTGKDLVTKDDLIWRAGYGSRAKLGIFIGGRDTQQRHSASLRDFLDFDEQELFFQIQVRTATDWTHSLSVHDGDRYYVNQIDAARTDLDFDYRQYAYEVDWQATHKTRFTVGVAQFERDGELNSDTGALLNTAWNWQVTPKVSLQMAYVLKQPALGEEIYSPTEEKNSLMIVGWQITEKWRLETGALHSDQTYRIPNSFDERKETLMRWRPLAIVFTRSESLDIRLDTEIYARESTEFLRDYNGELTNLRLKLFF